MILAMMEVEAYAGKSKINSAKKLPPVGIELLLWYILCYSHAFLTELTWQGLREGYLTLLPESSILGKTRLFAY